MNFYKISIYILVILFSVQASAIESPIAIDSRIKTFVYNPNAIYDVHFQYETQSFIEFGKDEKLKTVSLGSPGGWKVIPYGQLLFIKPLSCDNSTNMIITTERRIYIFDIHAEPGMSGECSKKSNPISNSKLSYVIRFYYPTIRRDDDDNGRNLPDLSIPTRLSDVASSADINSIIKNIKRNANFYYASVSGGDVSLKPAEIFDDNKLTYIRFSGNIIPKIFIVNKDKSEIAVPMSRAGDFIIIKGVKKEFALRYKKRKLYIFNQNMY